MLAIDNEDLKESAERWRQRQAESLRVLLALSARAPLATPAVATSSLLDDPC